MKFKHLMMSGLIAALAGFLMIGCNENPDDPNGGNSDSAAAVTSLAAVSLSTPGSVGLSWEASATSGATYKVSWTDGANSSGSVDATTTSAVATNLTPGVAYTFTVVAVASGKENSKATTITWAAASRYTTDKTAGGILRIYARSVSGKGSGIVVQQDGAYNALTAASQSDQALGMIHLIADVGSNSIKIGAPASFTDFAAVAKFRTDVQISDNYFEVAPSIGLDGWYSTASLDALFTTSNTSHFTVADQLTGGAGAAFAARWGTAGSYKYARIYVLPGSNGKLVQTDTSGDPFIEIQISYQTAAGVPYAKH